MCLIVAQKPTKNGVVFFSSVNSLVNKRVKLLIIYNNSNKIIFLIKIKHKNYNKLNTNIKNSDGKTPIYYAKDIYIIEKLINYGASILIKDNNGKTVSEYNPQIMSSFITYYSNKLKSRVIA